MQGSMALGFALAVGLWLAPTMTPEESYYEMVAATLLASPAGTVEPVPEGTEFDGVVAAIKRLAASQELMDPREACYCFLRAEDYQDGLDSLRKRREYLKDAPPVSDAHFLPERSYVNELLSLNRLHRRFAEERASLEWDRAWVWNLVLKDSDALYEIWDAARDARCEYYYVSVRRTALKKVRTLVGPNYEMPPAVPLWWFWVG